MRCLRWLAIVLLLGIGPWGFCSTEKREPIRVMTFNIRYNNANDGINAWPSRKDHVAELVGTRHKVDLAGLQEALKGQVDDLAERLSAYAWFGVGRDDGKKKGEFNPIFYKKKRFKLLESNTFWLSTQPEAPGSRSWNSACNRIVTWGKFRDRATGAILYQFNTHFDHKSEQAREESAKLLVQKIHSIAGRNPVVVTGDFNSGESSLPYAILTGKKPADPGGRSDLKDCRYLCTAGHEGPTSTFTNWVKYGPPETKIDFIFVGPGISVLTHKVLTDRFDGRFPSDHLPVISELRIPVTRGGVSKSEQ